MLRRLLSEETTFPPKRAALAGSVVFLLTVAIARFNSYVIPRFHIQVAGAHIHHYVFGIFILAAAGYLALALKSEGARFVISFLYGFGIALTFDEFGLWVNPPFVRGTRSNPDGLVIVVAVFTVIAMVTVGLKYWNALLAPRRTLVRYPPPRTAEDETRAGDRSMAEFSID